MLTSPAAKWRGISPKFRLQRNVFPFLAALLFFPFFSPIFPETERRRNTNPYTSACHVCPRFWSRLNIYLFSNSVGSCFSKITGGCAQKTKRKKGSKSPGSSERKERKKERAHFWRLGSSTKSMLPLYMTLIIGNLLQQWHPESIRTNSCPWQLGHSHFA